MYIEVVPNRNSKPCILLRESYRQDGKVRKRTLANLSKLPPPAVEGLRALFRAVLSSKTSPRASRSSAVSPTGTSRPSSALCARSASTATLTARSCAERDSGGGDDRGSPLGAEPPSSRRPVASARKPRWVLWSRISICPEVDESQALCGLGLVVRAPRSHREALGRRHLQDGSLVLYDVTSTYFEGSQLSFGPTRLLPGWQEGDFADCVRSSVQSAGMPGRGRSLRRQHGRSEDPGSSGGKGSAEVWSEPGDLCWGPWDAHLGSSARRLSRRRGTGLDLRTADDGDPKVGGRSRISVLAL